MSSTGTNVVIIPGGSIGQGVSSFGSTDAVFLTTIRDVWISIILWTMVFTSFSFFAAGILAVKVNKSIRFLWAWLPPLMLLVGGAVGFTHGAISAALIAAITICMSQRLETVSASRPDAAGSIERCFAHPLHLSCPLLV